MFKEIYILFVIITFYDNVFNLQDYTFQTSCFKHEPVAGQNTLLERGGGEAFQFSHRKYGSPLQGRAESGSPPSE